MDKSTTKKIGKAILLTVAISGVIALAPISPGLGYLLKEINKRKFQSYQPSRINQTLKRMQKQNLISIKEQKDQIVIELLEKGKKRVLSYKFDEMKLKKGKWDGIWRIVIFDIPYTKKVARDFLRTKMKQLGFYQLQKSVLVTPWECRNEIDFIKHFYEVSEYVNLIYAKSFDEQDYVKSYFRL